MKKDKIIDVALVLTFFTAVPAVCGYLFGKHRGAKEEFKRLKEAAAGHFALYEKKPVEETMKRKLMKQMNHTMRKMKTFRKQTNHTQRKLRLSLTYSLILHSL